MRCVDGSVCVDPPTKKLWEWTSCGRRGMQWVGISVTELFAWILAYTGVVLVAVGDKICTTESIIASTPGGFTEWTNGCEREDV